MRVTESTGPGAGASHSGAPPTAGAETDPRSPSSSSLEPLRELLLSQERSRLEQLQSRLADPDQRAADVADVLPDALMLKADDAGFIEALQQPVDQCLQHSVERNPQGLADVLFPVMGPAIRRAIGEALKNVVQSINQAVEHSISVKGLRWRFEAWRSGTSFAEVVIKNTLRYRVDAAYLIHNETGLLIEHALAETQTTLKDEDAMSAMLTAIQDFIQDSFTGTNEGLESVDIGGRSLWVLRGSRATLACVISGMPPHALREQLGLRLRDIHQMYRKQLERFDGDKAPLAGVEPLLRDCLTLEYLRDQDAGERPRRWIGWVLLGLLLLGLIGWHGWGRYVLQQRFDAARERLEEAPGVLVLDWAPWDDGRVRLLVDALAEPPAALIDDPDLLDRLRIETRPFVSADPPIVLRRAQRQLAVPPGVALALDQGVLRVGGDAPDDWSGWVRSQTLLPAGVEQIDLSGIDTAPPQPQPALPPLVRIRMATQAPDAVQLALNDSTLVLSGLAPWAWIAALSERLAALDEVAACEMAGLQASEIEQAAAIAVALTPSSFAFGEGTELLAEADQALDAAAAQLLELVALREAAPFSMEVEIIGYSDPTAGTEVWQNWLRERRAERVSRQLVERGVPADVLRTLPREGFEAPANPPSIGNEARLSVNLVEPPLPTCRSD